MFYSFSFSCFSEVFLDNRTLEVVIVLRVCFDADKGRSLIWWHHQAKLIFTLFLSFSLVYWQMLSLIACQVNNCDWQCSKVNCASAYHLQNLLLQPCWYLYLLNITDFFSNSTDRFYCFISHIYYFYLLHYTDYKYHKP